MAASLTVVPDSPRRRRRWPIVVVALAASAAGLSLLASWWFTAPIDDHPGADPPPTVATSTPPPPTSAPSVRPSWPDARLDGDEAKARLLAILEDVDRRFSAVATYTATFRKTERVGGTLLPEQTLAMKVRQRPFAIYFKFVSPKPGKEVLYVEGHHGGKVIAHNGDWTRRLVPRLAVDPTGSIALADNRHPITEAGLGNLIRKLIDFRKRDLVDAEAVTILDRATDDEGRPRLRSLHLHEHPNPERPFTRIEVLYDPETLFPLEITSYDWPAPGHSGPPPLAERYVYRDLKLDAGLSATDFDLANPAYEFLRY